MFIKLSAWKLKDGFSLAHGTLITANALWGETLLGAVALRRPALFRLASLG
jgi:hypothetical protein